MIDRNREIYRRRISFKDKYSDMAREYGISSSRVIQIFNQEDKKQKRLEKIANKFKEARQEIEKEINALKEKNV